MSSFGIGLDLGSMYAFLHTFSCKCFCFCRENGRFSPFSVISKDDVPISSSDFSPFQSPCTSSYFLPKRKIQKKIWYRKKKGRNERKRLLPNQRYKCGSGKEPLQKTFVSKSRRSPEANGFIRIATLGVFRRKDTQHTQQDKKYRCGRTRYGKRRGEERGKKENGLHFGFGVFMFSLEWVGMRNNHAVYRMRVGEQCDASQIGNE